MVAREMRADLTQSIIDLLIPGKTPGIKGPIVDLSGRQDPEILFFGPDEVSAASRNLELGTFVSTR